MRVVAAVPALGLLAGAAAGLSVPDPPTVVGHVSLFVFVAAAAWAWRTRRHLVFAALTWTGFAIGGAVLAGDAWREAWRPSLRTTFERLGGSAVEDDGTSDASAAGVAVVLTGVLRADASLRAGGVSLSLDARTLGPADRRPPTREIPVRGGVLLSVGGDRAAEYVANWRAGRTLRLPAQLRRPARYLNPGVPDGERVLARQGTTLVGSVKSAFLVEVVARGHPLAEWAAAARAYVRHALAEAVGHWSPRSAAIVTAIVIGDRAGLEADVERRLQEAGTYHVIAISGGNIALLTGIVLVLFRFAGWLGPIAIGAAMAGLVAYSAVVGEGGGRSVERATLMAVVYLAGRAIDLRGASLNALAIVAAWLSVVRPLAATDPGFLLTCGATTGIILVVSRVHARAVPRVARTGVMLLAASAAAEAVLMPVGAVFFSRVTFAGLVLNFAAIPLMAVAQVTGMAIVLVSAVAPPVAVWIGGVAHLAADGLVRSADLVAVAPWLTWRLAAPSGWAVSAYYGSLLAAWLVPTGRPRLAASATLAAVAAWILLQPWALFAARGDGRLTVTFLDVGQGDATLVRFPRGAAWLVDAGGLPGASAFDIGDRVVAPVLRHLGVRRLDVAALSHAHPDHVGGLPSILSEFTPRDIWDGVPVPPLAARQALLAMAPRARARWTTVQRHDRLVLDEVEVVVRHPPRPDWERQDVRNDDSIVLELRWKDVSIVLPGDIGRDVEAEIGELFEPVPIRVLKVPHHGSLTSSSAAFLRALAPRVAIVSAGRGNTYGHPAPLVVERYRDVGADIFRTDRDGAITVETDGRTLNVSTFIGRAREFR